MITKKFLHLNALKGTSLQKDVISHVLSRFDDYKDITTHIQEILEHGCISGIVSELVYYEDTVSFYYKHKEEINALLYNCMKEVGEYNLSHIFCNRYLQWDIEDPLALETHNQNLLAWFGFEETLYNFAIDWGIEF